MKNKNPIIIKSKIHRDSRGTLQEIFKKEFFLSDFKFSLLVNSKKNVFRGLHFQKKKQQEKQGSKKYKNHYGQQFSLFYQNRSP